MTEQTKTLLAIIDAARWLEAQRKLGHVQCHQPRVYAMNHSLSTRLFIVAYDQAGAFYLAAPRMDCLLWLPRLKWREASTNLNCSTLSLSCAAQALEVGEKRRSIPSFDLQLQGNPEVLGEVSHASSLQISLYNTMNGEIILAGSPSEVIPVKHQLKEVA